MVQLILIRHIVATLINNLHSYYTELIHFQNIYYQALVESNYHHNSTVCCGSDPDLFSGSSSYALSQILSDHGTCYLSYAAFHCMLD